MSVARRIVPVCAGLLAMGAGVVVTAVQAPDARAAPAVDLDVDAAACKLYEHVSHEQLMRRLSLDLRRQLPAYEEYAEVEGLVAGADEFPEAIIDDYLASDAFQNMARRFHLDLLWTSVDLVPLASTGSRLATGVGPMGSDILRSASTQRRQAYRGGGSALCQDKPQTDIQPAYQMGDVPTCEPDGTGLCLDGWVETRPYWVDPADPPLKVCAFEAQGALTGTVLQGPMMTPVQVACDERGAERAPECGCGPDLDWCFGPSVENRLVGAFAEQALRLIDDSTVGERPYSEFLTTQRTYTNGAIEHFKTHLADMSSLGATINDWVEGDAPLQASPDFLDDTWTQRTRGGAHYGVTTEPGYTLRFQTNRGRANRFRTVFMGRYFEPPAKPDVEGCSPEDPDLTQRCTCRHCHQTLEPLAAAYSDVIEAGSALMAALPDYDENCIGARDQYCERFYETSPDGARPGWQLRLQYADDETPIHEAIKMHVEAGVPGLIDMVIADGTFARTTVENLWIYFMDREMDLDPLSPDNEIELLDELSAQLQDEDDFKAIIKSIVMSDQYRRAR